MDKTRPKTIDDYIARHPEDVQKLLQKMRLTIRKAAPKAKERISYSMPAFDQDGILVWFAAFKEHIGFYPKTSAITSFKKDLTKYEVSKGTIRFPMDRPLPLGLITGIVKYRVRENRDKKK